MSSAASSLESILGPSELDLVVCETCGTQFETFKETDLEFCPICRDERQYEPLDGPHWTTLRKIQQTHKAVLVPDPERKNIYYAYASPSYAIGQRAIIFVCSDGIWIWDCFAVLTGELVEGIRGLEKESGGRVAGIVISHPHFFATSLSWAVALDTRVMVSAQDMDWFQRKDATEATFRLVPITSTNIDLSREVSTICVGGHFPGSRVFLHRPSKTLSVADSVGVTARQGCTFMWSYPNMIPLSLKEVQHIYDMLKEEDFETILGGWSGKEIPKDAKEVLRSSAVFWLKKAGWEEKGLKLQA